MITGEDIIDFIRNCKLENKILCQDNSDALMFINHDEWNFDSQRSDFEYIGINKQSGRYFKRTVRCLKTEPEIVNETYIAYPD